MTVLILKNTVTEGPGTIEGYLRERGAPFKVVELGGGEPVPPLEGFHALLMMGGPMAVYEAGKYGFLREGFKAIEEAMKRDMRVLGVCLGAQAVAHVLGARVYKGPLEEVGWLDVDLTSRGIEDPVTRTLTSRLRVFHWHGDTFDLPRGSRRLARSALYENQAFGYGARVYGLQFHIEVTPEMISGWFRGNPLERRMAEETGKYQKKCGLRALDFYREFFGFKSHKGGGMEKHFNWEPFSVNI